MFYALFLFVHISAQINLIEVIFSTLCIFLTQLYLLEAIVSRRKIMSNELRVALGFSFLFFLFLCQYLHA